MLFRGFCNPSVGDIISSVRTLRRCSTSVSTVRNTYAFLQVEKPLNLAKLFSTSSRRSVGQSGELLYELQKLDLLALDLDKVSDLPQKPVLGLHTVHYKGRGLINHENTPIYMIHGLFGNTHNYRSVGQKLSDILATPVYALDMRCHGDNPQCGPCTYEQMAKDVIFTLEKQDRNKCVLVGHSMGAKVAMLVSLMRPDLVEKLVVIDNSPASVPLDTNFYNDLLGLCHVERSASLDGITPLSRLYKAADTVLLQYEPDKMVRTFLLGNLRLEPNKTRLRVPVLNFLKDRVLDEMGHWPHSSVTDKVYDGPTLVMKAQRSDFITENTLRDEFPRYFSNFQVEQFDTGHWIVSDDPQAFINSVERFIDSK